VCWVVTEKNVKDVINFQWNCKARSRRTYKSNTLCERERERESLREHFSGSGRYLQTMQAVYSLL
jgi:hypothetical protein